MCGQVAVRWEQGCAHTCNAPGEWRLKLNPRDSRVAAAHCMPCGVTNDSIVPVILSLRAVIPGAAFWIAAWHAAVSCKAKPHASQRLTKTVCPEAHTNLDPVCNVCFHTSIVRSRARLQVATAGGKITAAICCRRSASVTPMGLPRSHPCCSVVHIRGCSTCAMMLHSS